jgi:hypothetical protein
MRTARRYQKSAESSDVFDDFGDTEVRVIDLSQRSLPTRSSVADRQVKPVARSNTGRTASPVPVRRVTTARGTPEIVQPEETGDMVTEIRHSFSKNRQRQLLHRGVDYNSFMRRNHKFDLTESLVRIQTEIPGLVTKSVSVKKQLKLLDSVIQRPLAANPVIGISSYPSDLRAKNLALYLMNRAFDYYASSNSRRIKNKAYPLWHRVYGGFGDSLRDTNDKDPPCFLVIANVDVNSTPAKLEKVRDLLDKYSDIPRVVVCSNCDPLTFFATRLHFLITAGFYLGPETCFREV